MNKNFLKWAKKSQKIRKNIKLNYQKRKMDKNVKGEKRKMNIKKVKWEKT